MTKNRLPAISALFLLAALCAALPAEGGGKPSVAVSAPAGGRYGIQDSRLVARLSSAIAASSRFASAGGGMPASCLVTLRVVRFLPTVDRYDTTGSGTVSYDCEMGAAFSCVDAASGSSLASFALSARGSSTVDSSEAEGNCVDDLVLQAMRRIKVLFPLDMVIGSPLRVLSASGSALTVDRGSEDGLDEGTVLAVKESAAAGAPRSAAIRCRAVVTSVSASRSQARVVSGPAAQAGDIAVEDLEYKVASLGVAASALACGGAEGIGLGGSLSALFGGPLSPFELGFSFSASVPRSGILDLGLRFGGGLRLSSPDPRLAFVPFLGASLLAARQEIPAPYLAELQASQPGMETMASGATWSLDGGLGVRWELADRLHLKADLSYVWSPPISSWSAKAEASDGSTSPVSLDPSRLSTPTFAESPLRLEIGVDWMAF